MKAEVQELIKTLKKILAHKKGKVMVSPTTGEEYRWDMWVWRSEEVTKMPYYLVQMWDKAVKASGLVPYSQKIRIVEGDDDITITILRSKQGGYLGMALDELIIVK